MTGSDDLAGGIGFYGGQTLTSVAETRVDTRGSDNVDNHISYSPPNTLQESTYQVRKRSLPFIEGMYDISFTLLANMLTHDIRKWI